MDDDWYDDAHYDDDVVQIRVLDESARLDAIERLLRRVVPIAPEDRCARVCPLGHQVIVQLGHVQGWCASCRAYRACT
ncbi:MAG: hypothetical protein M3Q55_09170 [Acidobacteriota bacterium]|nr:hypothetical protein [Acidobacteriota bacterium]